MSDFLNMIPRAQRAFTVSVDELRGLLPNIEKQLSEIPNDNSSVDGENTMIYAHYFFAGCDWWIVSHNAEDELFYCFAILNGDYQNAEFGYIEISDFVESAHNIELDYHFTPQTLKACLHEKGLVMDGYQLFPISNSA